MNKITKEQLLPRYKSPLAGDKEIRIQTELTNNVRELPLGQLNSTLNVSEQYDKERQESDIYRFSGEIDPYFTNILIETTKGDSLKKIDDFVKPIGNLTSRYSRNDLIMDIDGWAQYPGITGSSITSFDPRKNIFFNPKPDNFNMLTTGGTKNWIFNLVYPSGKTQNIIYNQPTFSHQPNLNWSLERGIPIIHIDNIKIKNKTMTLFVTKIPHGFDGNSKISLTGFTNPKFNGIKQIKTLNSKDSLLDIRYTFILDIVIPIKKNLFGSFSTVQNMFYVSRVINDVISKYYVRTFGVIAQHSDFEIFCNAFSRTEFNDCSVSYVLRKDINVGNLVDYVGRPVSEIYLALVKRAGENPYPFTDVVTGLRDVLFEPKNGIVMDIRHVFDINYIGDKLNPMHNGRVSTYNPVGLGSEKLIGDQYLGDIVEYNHGSLFELILSKFMHRFNTTNRRDANYSSGIKVQELDNNGKPKFLPNGDPVLIIAPAKTRREGYYYDPFVKIPIRTFSNFSEISEDNADVPFYSEKILKTEATITSALTSTQSLITGTTATTTTISANTYTLSAKSFTNLGTLIGNTAITETFITTPLTYVIGFTPLGYSPNTGTTASTFTTIIKTNINDTLIKNLYTWKDLLPKGFLEVGNSAVSHPFLNNCHYVFNSTKLMLRRQKFGIVPDDIPFIEANLRELNIKKLDDC